MRFLSFLLMLGFCSVGVKAQPGGDIWSLERCVQYALSRNLSVKQSVLNERLAALTLKQSRLSQLPNLNIAPSYGRSFGRSVDPTTNQFVQGSYDFLGLGGNADVLVFGWFQRRRLIAQNDLSHQAAIADLDQLKDDISLNVTTGYLRALLAKEQIGVNEKQVSLSQQQLVQTQKFAEAGRVPQINVSQLKSQLATDSAALITAIADYTASLLDLRALLNLDFEAPFEVQAPNVSLADQQSVLSTTPLEIHTVASRHFGAIRSSELNLSAAQMGLKASRAQRYPQLVLNAQLGSNYATTYKDYGTPILTGEQIPTGNFVTVGGTQYPIYQPGYNLNVVRITPLGTQFGDNFRHTYSLNLNIPIFNGWQAQAGVRRAQISVASQELNRDQAALNLKQNVYKAYNDARNSVQRYYAAERAAEAAREAFGYAQRRYDMGLTNTVEYLTIQNNQYRADASLSSAKYDLLFRLKVIDYYLGEDLKF
jgi:outer membrane protein